jgi:hypothetical protein
VLPTGKIWNKTLIFAECITNARTAYNEAVQALPYSAEFPQLMDGMIEQVSNLIKLCHRNLKQKPQCIFNLQMKVSATLWDSQLVASCAKLRGMTTVPPPSARFPPLAKLSALFVNRPRFQKLVVMIMFESLSKSFFFLPFRALTGE